MVGAGTEQTSCVADVHDVVAHGWPEMYAEGLSSTSPKPAPRMVTAGPCEAGAFSGEKPVAKAATGPLCRKTAERVRACACVHACVCVRVCACIDIDIGVDTFT